MPPCCPSCILLCRTMGLLLVRICMPARALPYMLLYSTKPRPSPNMYTPPWLPLKISFLLKQEKIRITNVFQCAFWLDIANSTVWYISQVRVKSPYGRVAVGSYPHSSKVIRMNLVVDKLTTSILMNINATRLAVVNLALDDRWVCSCLHLKASYPIVVDIVAFKIALKHW